MITTAEIARIAGVSRGTVSRVLNNSPNVNDKTRKKIKKLIEEANYIPNEAARSLVMRKSFKVAFITFSKPQNFWDEIKKGFDLARKELSHTGIDITFIETDIENPYEQIQVIDKVIKEKYDGIALCPNNPSIMYPSLKKLEENNIPVVLYNVDMPNANSVAFVGCNHYQSGVLAGEVFKKMYTARKGRIAIFTLRDFILPIDERVQGFLSIINNCNNIEIVDTIHFSRDVSNLENTFEKLVKEKSIDGLFLTTAGLENIGKSVYKMGLAEKFILVGYDFNDGIKEYLSKNCITSTITHEPVRQSYEAIHILYKFLNLNETPDNKINYTKLELIMDSNS